MCSRKQKRIFQTLLLLTVVFGFLYGAMLHYELQTQLRKAEAVALKYQQHQESLSAQLQGTVRATRAARGQLCPAPLLWPEKLLWRAVWHFACHLSPSKTSEGVVQSCRTPKRPGEMVSHPLASSQPICLKFISASPFSCQAFGWWVSGWVDA
jgi:hypothetical protein